MHQAEAEREQPPLSPLVRALRAWGLGGLAAELLEHGGPLTFLGAQALYFTAPLVEPFGSGRQWAAWAETLEDPAAVHRLTGQLRAPKQDAAP